MSQFFTIRTTGYNGPELGPKDTVSVHIQRYNTAGLIVSREVLAAIVTECDNIDPNMTSPYASDEACREFAKLASDEAHRALKATPNDDPADDDPRPYHDLERLDEEQEGKNES